MRKISKRITALMLASSMVASLTACGGGKDSNTNGTETPSASTQSEVSGSELAADALAFDPTADAAAYAEESAAAYEANLGEFKAAYDAAQETNNLSERFALMAIAEAKFLESAVMLPTTTRGGNYAISRIVPKTAPNTLWGNDNERVHSLLVTTEFVTAEDRDAIVAKWGELRGTGEFEAWVESFLKEKGYTLKDSFAQIYTGDPETWDVLATSQQVDSEQLVQTYDGLLEYDMEGTLQPKLAESYDVSEDGLTYTFNLRKGVKWVDSQGREVAEVKADDFVAGMQHMMDAMGGLEYLVEGIIVNASEYINGEVTDFSQVGVKAVDDYTLEYTLEAPCSFFTTMFGYGVFAPLSRAYYESKGGKFGAEFDPAAADYVYAKDPDSIAYCGPFLITSATEKNSIVFEANPAYWDAANQNIKKYTAVFNDGSEATKGYKDALAGTIDGAGLNASALELAKADGNFEKYCYVVEGDATTFSIFYNVNRNAFANVNDTTTVRSTQTVADAERVNAAMNNVHFRRALSFATDRATWNAQSVGEELKYASVRNSFTPGNFVSLSEDTTVDINGTATTFEAGTFYGEIVQAQIDADGVTMKVWDPEAEAGNGSSDGFDGWYNAENAKAELAKAVEELSAAGVEVSAENPICFDIPYFSGSENRTNMANAYKQSVESALDGAVVVNLVECVDVNDYYYAGYFTTYGYESNYDAYDLSGWGPDYGDPQTYLNTFLPDYAGYMAKNIGIY